MGHGRKAAAISLTGAFECVDPVDAEAIGVLAVILLLAFGDVIRVAPITGTQQ